MDFVEPLKKNADALVISPHDGEDVVVDTSLWSDKEEKAVLRRTDLMLMPAIWVMYLFSYADRTNIGNAKVAGMATDLHLSSSQYSMSLVIFFISYVVFEVPSNLILSKTRPSIYLTIMMAAWGIVTCCMGTVKSYGGLLAVRFIIGVLEAAYAPGVTLLLSTWYKKDEQAQRFSIFYSAAVLSGAFGGIVSGAITGHLDGARGIAGWRWLFIVEGAATIFVAIVSFFILPDFPATTKRLSPRQKHIATQRLFADNISSRTEDQPLLGHFEAVKASLLDWRVWILTMGYVSIGGVTTMSYFYPTLVAGLGYTSTMAQYMMVPIYGAAFVFVLLTGWLSDRYPGYRGLTIAAWLTVSMTCAIVVSAVYNYTARYVMLVFMASGGLSANALSLAYCASTFGPMPQEVRAVSLAFVNTLASLSGIYGAYLWPAADSPKYLMGFGVISGLCAVGAGIYASAHFLIRRFPL
ncbi:hypothetical protein A1O1_07206 [Capronia coronata CBS 617.96]|uniref:Major facilitator superfamily (MFS) profile domain-containing protein n=1 Tax=Capronia coronata CBS 617.96 TaxID=1182541 RepID=W9XTM2_9EURO|nr:uncharacterized protein A1O1_07206 [Capronia coronata CBS 617.96]EXJ83583.1 hypothetical protein A1O1_07206 [Capronia coronata CBS 617.96]